MKNQLAILGAVLCMAGSAQGAIYGGTITYTITEIEEFTGWDDFLVVGQSWSHPYSYASPAVDGTFTPSSGALQLAFFDGSLSPSLDNDYPNSPTLTVTGGQVTRLSINLDNYLSQTNAIASGSNGGWWVDGFVRGDLVITAPTLQSVPDSGAPLSLGLLALAAMVRQSRFQRSRRS